MPLPLLFIPLMLVVMWVFVILPQQRRVKAHDQLVASLQEGVEVMTTAGLYGTLVELGEETAILEIAPGTRVKIARASVGALVEVAEPAGPDAAAPGLTAAATEDGREA